MDVVINDTAVALPDESIQSEARGDFFYRLLSLCGYSTTHFPLAALLANDHGLKGDWSILSLIHWQATHNDARVIAAAEDLNLTEEISGKWFSALKEFVAEDQIALFYHDANTWLLQHQNRPSVYSPPVFDLYHQSVLSCIKELDATMYWQRFITEAQMFMSEHPLNQGRIHLPVNGLWVWGAGELSTTGARPIICGDKKLAEIAYPLSTEVSLYQPQKSYPDNAILLFSNLDLKHLALLQQQLKKHRVTWHWNNCSYTTKASRWWSRLWSK